MSANGGPGSRSAVEELESTLLEERFYGPGLRFCLERMGEVDAKRILEIGCGRGELAVLLAARGARVTGIDLRGDDLAHARRLAARIGVTCRFVEGDAHELPATEAPFDMIVSKSTLQYMDRRHVLEMCTGALADDGMLVLNENLSGNPAIRTARCLRSAASGFGVNADYARSIRGYVTFGDIRWLERRFATLEHHEAHLLRVLVTPHNGRRPDGLLGFADDAAQRIDDALLSRVPVAARCAWLTAIVAQHPLTATGRGRARATSSSK